MASSATLSQGASASAKPPGRLGVFSYHEGYGTIALRPPRAPSPWIRRAWLAGSMLIVNEIYLTHVGIHLRADRDADNSRTTWRRTIECRSFDLLSESMTESDILLEHSQFNSVPEYVGWGHRKCYATAKSTQGLSDCSQHRALDIISKASEHDSLLAAETYHERVFHQRGTQYDNPRIIK